MGTAFIRFSGISYYPLGGAEDRPRVFETLEDAKTAPVTANPDWAHFAELAGGELRLVCVWDRESGEYRDV